MGPVRTENPDAESGCALRAHALQVVGRDGRIDENYFEVRLAQCARDGEQRKGCTQRRPVVGRIEENDFAAI